MKWVQVGSIARPKRKAERKKQKSLVLICPSLPKGYESYWYWRRKDISEQEFLKFIRAKGVAK